MKREMKEEEFDDKNGDIYVIREIPNKYEDESKVQIFDKKTGKPVSLIYSPKSGVARDIRVTTGQDAVEELFKIAKKDFLDKDSQANDRDVTFEDSFDLFGLEES